MASQPHNSSKGDKSGSSPAQSGPITGTAIPQPIRAPLFRTKRSWSEEEDDLLIHILLDLLSNGIYKTAHGFKPGLYTAVKKEFQRRKPGCGIRADPYIYSRMKTLKSHFSIISDMLYQNMNGFSWDPVNKRVTAEDAVWTTYLQNHKSAAQFKGRTFKYFDELAIILGANWENGQRAADHATATKHYNRDFGIAFNLVVDASPNQSILESDTESSSSDARSCRRKRKSSSDDDFLVAMKETIAKMNATLYSCAEKLCAAITDADLSAKQATLHTQLCQNTSLSQCILIKAHITIGCDIGLLHVFSTLDDKDKESFVRSVLDKSK